MLANPVRRGSSARKATSEATHLLAAVNRFKFLKLVRPGAELRIETTKVAEVRPMAYVEAVIRVHGEIVARGELSVTSSS